MTESLTEKIRDVAKDVLILSKGVCGLCIVGFGAYVKSIGDVLQAGVATYAVNQETIEKLNLPFLSNLESLPKDFYWYVTMPEVIGYSLMAIGLTNMISASREAHTLKKEREKDREEK